MSDKVFIDTVFVIALVNRRDTYHAKALELSDLFDQKLFLTTDVVLLEIGNALARNFKQQSIEIIDSFLSSSDVEIVHLTPQLFERAYSLYKQYQDKEWGLIDCISFEVMREAGVTAALTFDQHFVQAGFQALMRD
ncbi:MAG: PIN domain-containing protein [Roseiflexus sp.]|nr:PIN domain-containing protein [Roseiflexus sp.]MCS7288284.1 PIN domain-containing protein [Roseiflexus sp.]MDW8145173.1 PIN domain-containing protein [Roseiflexaceae bacterium]